MKISIITVTYNCLDTIKSTLKSVSRLDSKIFEHIVIDGGSTDGTIDIINEYASNLSYFVSEPDDGIFDAMNKGAARAVGDYILFLNSGDILHENFSINQEFLSDENTLIYFSYKISGSDVVHKPGIRHPFGLPTSHQAILIPRNVFNTYNFSQSFKVAADFNQYISIKMNSEIKHIYCNDVISIVLPGGFSFENRHLMHKEYAQILKSNFGIFKWIAYIVWSSSSYRWINGKIRNMF